MKTALTFFKAFAFGLSLATVSLVHADTPESAVRPEAIAETTRVIEASEMLELTLSPAGGYATVLSPQQK